MSLFFSLLRLFADNQAAKVDTAVWAWSYQILNGLGCALVAIAVCGRHGVVEGMAVVGDGKRLITVAARHEIVRVLSVDRPRVGGIYII